MGRYVYPAVFTTERDGRYSVYFPDIEGCYTCGDNLADAIYMAEDALALMLYEYEHDGKAIPKPTDPKDIKTESGEFVNMIAADSRQVPKKSR